MEKRRKKVYKKVEEEEKPTFGLLSRECIREREKGEETEHIDGGGGGGESCLSYLLSLLFRFLAWRRSGVSAFPSRSGSQKSGGSGGDLSGRFRGWTRGGGGIPR